MYYSSLLTAGLGLEVCKHKLPSYVERAVIWLDNTADALDDKYGKPYDCTGNLLCQRTKIRHRKDCIGRTIDIDTYVSKVTRA